MRVRSTCRRNSCPRPTPCAAPFDEAGQVGEHELPVAGGHDAEVRVLRGERVRGDLRRGPRHPRQERRLARVREPDQPGVGDHLEFERDPALLALLARLELARRAVGAGLEVDVPAAAPPALRGDQLVAGVHEVLQHVAAVAVADDRAGRHEQDHVLGVGAGLARAAARVAVLGPPVLPHREAGEVVGVRVGADDDRPAVPAVAPVGAALGHELLPPEGREPAAAVPALHEQFHAIDEHC